MYAYYFNWLLEVYNVIAIYPNDPWIGTYKKSESFSDTLENLEKISL